MLNSIERTQLLTVSDVLGLTGYKSRSSLYRLMDKKMIPNPISIGGGRIRWRSGDIEDWLKSLPPHTTPSQEGDQ
jgi:prophage regulatory protein